MKRIIVLAFLFVILFSVFSQAFEPTPIPRTMEFLFVNPSLRGGTVISNENIKHNTKNIIVEYDGRTSVWLVVGSVYIIKLDNKYFYPNGDECAYCYDGRAVYFGDRKWLNSAYPHASKTPIKQYFVTWPPD